MAEDETDVTRMAGLATAMFAVAPCQIKYTRRRAGRIIAQGSYVPGEDGRWRAEAPSLPAEIN